MECLDVLLEHKPCLVATFSSGKQLEVPFIDIYCQSHREDLITLEDLVATSLAWQMVLRGGIIYEFIQAREPPHADKSRDENQAILTDMVEHYRRRGVHDLVAAEFWGGTQGADGAITFATPLIKDFRGCPINSDGTPASTDNTSSIQGRCNSFPLEVGYCMPDQIAAHFLREGCVARFPYGHNMIVFLEKVDEPSGM